VLPTLRPSVSFMMLLRLLKLLEYFIVFAAKQLGIK